MHSILTSICLILFLVVPSGKPAWKLYSLNGKESSYDKLERACRDADIILFGEAHNNPIAHWLQVELIKDILKEKSVIIGGEFFERDDQIIINEYLNGLIEYRHLEAEAKLWTNFETDYLPILDLAKSNQIPFIATNVPRRYASMVARFGPDTLKSLDPECKKWITPLPFEFDSELPGYKAMSAMGMHHGQTYHMAEAQALKDATMSYSILEALQKNYIFFHINGSYHSNNKEGIYWYLKKRKPDLKIVTISTVEQDDISLIEENNKKLADFIIVTPASLTKTH